MEGKMKTEFNGYRFQFSPDRKDVIGIIFTEVRVNYPYVEPLSWWKRMAVRIISFHPSMLTYKPCKFLDLPLERRLMASSNGISR
jgi:hypothetical protein